MFGSLDVFARYPKQVSERQVELRAGRSAEG
jgi:hypothetical protein